MVPILFQPLGKSAKNSCNVLGFFGKLYKKSSVCLAPGSFGFINGNNSAGNIVGNNDFITKIFCVLKEIISRFKTVLNAPETETLDMAYTFFIKFRRGIFIANKYFFSGYSKIFFCKPLQKHFHIQGRT